MAATVGKDGYVALAGSTVAFIDSWSVNPSVNTAELTYYGSSWELHDPTIKTWTGTFSGTLDRSDTEQASLLDQLEDAVLANVTVRFYIGANYWSGTAVVESWSIDSAVKDKVAVTFNVKGDGALSYT